MLSHPDPLMPNTLGHFAVQGPLGRGLFRGIDIRWVYLGCLLPDVPWILRRSLETGFTPALDPFALRLYVYTQASLAATLLLCGACAAWSRAPLKVFSVLGLNALLHLLLDASQIKWGSGVLLAAPLSWDTTNFGLYWPESPATLVITAVGALVITRELTLRRAEPGPIVYDRSRLTASSVLLAAYLVLPLLFVGTAEARDLYYIRTLREAAARPGRSIEIDRVPFERDGDRTFIHIWTGERLELIGSAPARSGVISLRGRFADSDTIRLDGVHAHSFNRDIASYIGLIALALLWRPPLGRGRRPSREPG